MTRTRTNISNMTEEERVDHRRAKWREKRANWMARNPGKHAEDMAARYRADPATNLAAQKARRDANPEPNKAACKKRYWNDPETARAYAREHTKRNPEARKRADLKKSYGITLEEYEALVQVQGNTCGICGSSYIGPRSKYWHVDHNHQTGVVRGLLCNACNMAGGGFKDDPLIIQKAVAWFSRIGEPQ